MRRHNRPDVMTILVMLVAVGVLTTGLVQGMVRKAQQPAVMMSALK